MYFLIVKQGEHITRLVQANSVKEINEGPLSIRGIGYETKEQLYKAEGVLEKPCCVCKGIVETTYYHKAQLIKKNMCFSCDCWGEKYKAFLKDNDTDIAVIDGTFYKICPNQPDKKTSGFGGREFNIHFAGKTVTTTNLWCGGDIPDIYRDKIPDNAKFVSA